MISYAQNFEDIVLARAFLNQSSGFYIDVGANHPTHNSITKHFYDSGWRGINVEPGSVFADLAEHRPADVNLNIALSNYVGTATLFHCDSSPLSTLCKSVASTHEARSHRLAPVSTQVSTLEKICQSHVTGAIDFLSIDVEGHEHEVIEGGNWTRFRPRIVVVESTHPNSTTPSHHSWEPILMSAGYDLALFDGLNRFYVRKEEPELLKVVSVPANAFDVAIPYRDHYDVVQLRGRIAELEALLCDMKHERPWRYYGAKALRRIAALIATR